MIASLRPKLLPLLQKGTTTAMRTIVSQQIEYTEWGDPLTVLKFATRDVPSPKADEVRYKFLASAINPADINTIQGVYPIRPEVPAVAGMEGVMRIEEVGANVKDLKVGDKVIPRSAIFGAWRSAGVTTPDQLIKVSSELDDVQAATITVNPSTAYRMLKDYVDLQPGDVILQNGANSAVGQLVIQLCSEFKVTSVNLIRDGKQDEKETKLYLEELGADFVFTQSEFKKEGRTLFKGKLTAPKLALNCVSGPDTIFMAGVLAPKGKMVTYGGMSKQPLQVPTGPFIFKGIELHGYWLTIWNEQPENQMERLRTLDYLTGLLTKHKLKMPKFEPVLIKDYRKAVEATLHGHGRKKIFVFEWLVD
uniref:Enoyl-[acyl-carrier-protein] reductase, mitochondrial n=1 Tax=Trichuris muris TaxID=70415 RepID=A0A5S6QY26_TRIMR